MTAAAALEVLFGRRDRRAVFNHNSWCRYEGDPSALVSSHLAGRIVLGAMHGGEPTTTVAAIEADGASHALLSERLGRAVDARAAAHALSGELGRLGFHPPLVCTSKSGDGFHVRVVFDEPVPTGLARAVMRAVKQRIGLGEIDVVYPGAGGDGLVLALPLAGFESGGSPWVKPGGSRLVHPETLRPYPDATQVEGLIHWPRSTAVMLGAAAARLGVSADSEPRPQSSAASTDGPVKHRWRERLPVYENELDTLASECAFIQYAAERPELLSYEQWFSLATVLAAFPGGGSLFDEISARDTERYVQGEPRAKLESVSLPPRHCRNLGWTCPKAAACEAIGVRSPAGLPYKLRARKRSIEESAA